MFLKVKSYFSGNANLRLTRNRLKRAFFSFTLLNITKKSFFSLSRLKKKMIFFKKNDILLFIAVFNYTVFSFF